MIIKKILAGTITASLVLGAFAGSSILVSADDKTITVAASATPHAEILDQAAPLLEEH